MTSSERDSFKTARAASDAIGVQIGDERIAMLLTYKGVRNAAKNWQTFSSDTPFRVPIPSEEDQRSVRQLPIETDPPLHRKYRSAIEPFFRRPMQAEYLAQIEALIRDTLIDCAQRPSFDIVHAFALPVQSRALALLLGVPKAEAETWMGWGTHVFHDGPDSAQKGADLETYLRDTIEASRSLSNPDNFFTALNTITIDQRPLSLEEKLGLANLVFAGGRDTVINTIAFLFAHFAHHPDALTAAAETERSINLAVEECIRVVTPLTHIGRTCKQSVTVTDLGVAAGSRVSLCWAAANYDPSVFSNPEQVDLARAPNPHVGFGSGPHTCLGAPQARAILRSLIRVLHDMQADLQISEADPKHETIGPFRRRVGFDRLIGQLRLAP